MTDIFGVEAPFRYRYPGLLSLLYTHGFLPLLLWTTVTHWKPVDFDKLINPDTMLFKCAVNWVERSVGVQREYAQRIYNQASYPHLSKV